MNVTARMSSTYQWRLAVLAAIFLFFAGWSAYDGLVRYPRINRIAEEFKSYLQDHPDDGQQTWPDYAKEHGLPREPELAKSATSLYAQYGMAILTLPVGLAALVAFVRGFSRHVTAGDKGLRTESVPLVEYSAIRSLLKERWRTKGIAYVVYDDQGIERRLLLDDWKYDRDATTEILRLVEDHLQDEQITGDIRESAKPQPAAAAPPEATEPAPEATEATERTGPGSGG